MPTLDFGFNANPTDSGTEPVTDLDTGVTGTVGSDGNIIPPIDEPNNGGQDNNGKTDGDGKKDDVDNPAANANDKDGNDDGNKGDDNDLAVDPGSVVTIGEDTYTVDAEGNLVDKNNKVFKEAKDVKDFLKQFEVDDTGDTENVIDVAKIIEKVGFEVTDEMINLLLLKILPMELLHILMKFLMLNVPNMLKLVFSNLLISFLL